MIAIKKLTSVPISTYSVSRLSLAVVNSPNRKMDLAASRKPICFPLFQQNKNKYQQPFYHAYYSASFFKRLIFGVIEDSLYDGL